MQAYAEVFASEHVLVAGDSSVAASQSSLVPLHTSTAPGRTAAIVSSQSVELLTYPDGAVQAVVVVNASPKVSPSKSR